MISARIFSRSSVIVASTTETNSLPRWPGSSPRPSFAPKGMPMPAADVEVLTQFISEDPGRLVCLTGAGCSTESGVPDYRSPEGSYSKGHRPMRHSQFVNDSKQRARYWARSLGGWRFFDSAQPNVAHRALTELERLGYIQGLITQNVDGLHQKAGMVNVVDLHGRNDQVVCLNCESTKPRREFQQELEHVNQAWIAQHLSTASIDVRADGDAHLETKDFAEFKVPPCSVCGGVLKPRVVFFGGALDPKVKDSASHMIDGAARLLVLGSSVQVFSAFSLVKKAAEVGKPVAIINIGETRGDALVAEERRYAWRCGEALSAVCKNLGIAIP